MTYLFDLISYFNLSNYGDYSTINLNQYFDKISIMSLKYMKKEQQYYDDCDKSTLYV